MKQNIFLIIILIGLFFFGLLIYDFSDQIDTKVTSHDWYLYEDDRLTIISFSDEKFSYFYEDNKKAVTDYDLCLTYRFNRSINVVKLNCNVIGNKIYIGKYDEKTLNLTINDKAKIFYATKELAEIAKFKSKNLLSDDAFDDLNNIDFTKYNNIDIENLSTMYKSKDYQYVALYSNVVTLNNIFNSKYLDNLIVNNPDIYTLAINNFTDDDVKKLVGISKIFSAELKDYQTSVVYIYKVGNKKVSLVKTIDIESYDIFSTSDYILD